MMHLSVEKRCLKGHVHVVYKMEEQQKLAHSRQKQDIYLDADTALCMAAKPMASIIGGTGNFYQWVIPIELIIALDHQILV